MLGLAQTFPDVDPTVTNIDEVPLPELIDQPEGTVQLYDVAFNADVVYSSSLPSLGTTFPFTVAAPGNWVTVTYKLPADPLPQLFEGVAETFPEELPTVTDIDEVP